MTNEGSEPSRSRAAIARELELELTKLRNEASAARLEAKAAELELVLQRYRDSFDEADAETGKRGGVDPSPLATTVAERSAADPVSAVGPESPTNRFRGWDEVRTRLLTTEPDTSRDVPARSHASDTELQEAARPESTRQVPERQVAARQVAARQVSARQVSAGPEPAGPEPARHRNPALHGSHRPKRMKDESESPQPDERATAAGPPTGTKPAIPDRPSVGKSKPGRRNRRPTSGVSGSGTHDLKPAALRLESIPRDEASTTKRRRPAAWVVSFCVHVALLFVLGLCTLATQPPRDQVALAATTSDPADDAMETFAVEVSEPELEEPEEPITEPEIETSPVGEIAVSEFALDPSPTPPTPKSFSAMSALTSVSASPDASEKMEFCGVEGGGNHFVYLVDSSGSMGSAFESARAELLRSIALLRPDQRFYVVFFDENPDYMRLADPNRDEPASVMATPENKRRLARWATAITKDRGRAPYEPLRFALELRPDVIFLLSDGEFPQRIEDQLRDENRYENLFGDSGPVCIVHTIGYHSREGETRMRRIAEQNGGQYRHVPKP